MSPTKPKKEKKNEKEEEFPTTEAFLGSRGTKDIDMGGMSHLSGHE